MCGGWNNRYQNIYSSLIQVEQNKVWYAIKWQKKVFTEAICIKI